jgi:hypothetical protein
MSNANTTILTDKNGVLREYREVKRKANVGERIKMTDTYDVGYDAGDVFSVRNVDTLGQARFYDNDGDERAAYAHRYVVLEPTDIVIIDGVRYREERRKARKGERILYVWEGEQSQVYTAIYVEENGDVRVVDEYDDGTLMIHYGAYRVLTPIDAPQAPTAVSPQVINVNLTITVQPGTDVAQAVADAVKREITKMSAQEFVSHAEELLGLTKSPQQFRDEIVERAKRDIEELKTTHYPTLAQYYIARNITWNPECDAEFIVNREKRTIVCLLRAQRYDGKGKVVSRGIAKCAPDDCFNVHIGKAIALRRALGLPVPIKYLNAPQPTEVRVGDIVNGSGLFGAYTPDKTFTITADRGDNSFKYAERPSDWIYRHQIGRIIDDSREEVSA